MQAGRHNNHEWFICVDNLLCPLSGTTALVAACRQIKYHVSIMGFSWSSCPGRFETSEETGKDRVRVGLGASAYHEEPYLSSARRLLATLPFGATPPLLIALARRCPKASVSLNGVRHISSRS